MNRELAVLLAALTVLGLAGCGSTINGTAHAGDVAASTPPPVSVCSSPCTSATLADLVALQPCGLLDAATMNQNGLTSEGSRTGDGACSCSWKNASYDAGLGYSLGVDIRDSQGIGDYNRDGCTISNTAVGDHQAVEAKQDLSDLCDITIGVTPTSQVDIDTGAADIDRSSELVSQFVKLIERKLPLTATSLSPQVAMRTPSIDMY